MSRGGKPTAATVRGDSVGLLVCEGGDEDKNVVVALYTGVRDTWALLALAADAAAAAAVATAAIAAAVTLTGIRGAVVSTRSKSSLPTGFEM